MEHGRYLFWQIVDGEPIWDLTGNLSELPFTVYEAEAQLPNNTVRYYQMAVSHKAIGKYRQSAIRWIIVNMMRQLIQHLQSKWISPL